MRSALTTSTILLASGFCMAMAPAAQASSSGATHDRFQLVTHETFEAPIPECFSSDLVGTNVATETTSGRFTEASSGVTSISGSNAFAYRVDFPNGMYAEGVGTSHFSFVAAPNVSVHTEAGSEPRTVYSAAGVPVAHVRIHAVSHVTYSDLNGDGQPEADEISASVDRFFFTC
jgi:hypothetical protein